MRKIIFSLLFLLAFFVHFSSGIYSDARAAQEEKKGEVKKEEIKGEEKKEEEKKPSPPDKTGVETRNTGAIEGEGYKEADPKKADPEVYAGNFSALMKVVAKNRSAIDLMWTLITGFLVMFMQAGFAMVETGLTRAKNVAHTMAMNFMVYAIGMLGFYFVGFALMFGGVGISYFGNEATLLSKEFSVTIGGKSFGLFGYEGFMLTGKAFDVGLLAIFLFQMVFMDTTATIPTGSMAERWKFLPFVIYGFLVSTIIYPIYGNWVWGGGWLSQLGTNFNLGHGHVDFAGSSVVHLTGGVLALAGAIIIGPRLGKYNKDGTVNVLPAHNVPMYMVGTFILAFGWFGFNPGSSLAASDLNIARCAVNTMLASAAGAFTSMVFMWVVYGKPDPSFMCNGLLAGLVAITAPCAFITPLAAVTVGAIAGILVILSCLFWEKVAKIDDPVGAISVHGINGAWGILALGLLADGSYGTAGWNNRYLFLVNETQMEWSFMDLSGNTAKEALDAIEETNKSKKPGEEKVSPPGFLTKLAPTAKLEKRGVTGLFYGNPSQFVAECIGILANIVYVFIVGYLCFYLVEITIGNRVSAEAELQGLDIPEMGVLGYITEDPKVPEGHLTTPGMEPRPAKVPPDGKKRFALLVEGIGSEDLAAVWSDLCKPGSKPPPDFLAIYPKVTFLQGNRFQFVDSNPEVMKDHMHKLIQSQLVGKGGIKVKVE